MATPCAPRLIVPAGRGQNETTALRSNLGTSPRLKNPVRAWLTAAPPGRRPAPPQNDVILAEQPKPQRAGPSGDADEYAKKNRGNQ